MNPVQNSTTLNRVMGDFSSEVSKEKPDFRNLMEMMMVIHALFHQEFSNQYQKDLRDLLEDLRVQVKDAVDAHNPLGKTVANVTFAMSNLFVGCLGTYGVLRNPQLHQLSQTLTPLVNVPDIIGRTLTSFKDADLQQKQQVIKETETKQNLLNQDCKEHQRQTTQSLEQAKETDRLFREIISTLCQPVHL